MRGAFCVMRDAFCVVRFAFDVRHFYHREIRELAEGNREMHSALDVRRSIFDVRCSIKNAG